MCLILQSEAVHCILDHLVSFQNHQRSFCPSTLTLCPIFRPIFRPISPLPGNQLRAVRGNSTSDHGTCERITPWLACGS